MKVRSREVYNSRILLIGLMGLVDLGAILALSAASVFGLNDAIVKRISYKAETLTIVLYSLIVGSPILLLAAFIFEPYSCLKVSENAFLGYMLVGVGHFVFGRTIMYYSIKRIGGGPAAVIASTNPVLTALIGVFLLGEPSTFSLWTGLFLVFSGAILTSSQPSNAMLKIKDPVGVAIAFSASLIFSFTTIGIRFLNVSSGSPIVGATISYFTALTVYMIVIVLRGRIKVLVSASEKPLLILAGFLVTIGQLLRFLALNYTYASIVSPLISTFTFFALFFLKLIPGTWEKVGLTQILGASITFIGVYTILS